MTVIHLTPLLQAATERVAADATLIARASFPFLADGAAVVAPQQLRWDFTAGQPSPTVELDEPEGFAWLLQLQIGAWKQTRAVTWLGAELDWADLTDVNPSTLASEGAPQVPTGQKLITRDDALAAVAVVQQALDAFELLDENGDASVATALAARPTAASVAATYSTLAQLAASPDLLAVGTITRSGTGAATGFGVVWPDGSTGTFTGTESSTTPGAIDSYTVTKIKSGVTVTFTQPALTRDASGAVTSRPAITAA